MRVLSDMQIRIYRLFKFDLFPFVLSDSSSASFDVQIFNTAVKLCQRQDGTTSVPFSGLRSDDCVRVTLHRKALHYVTVRSCTELTMNYPVSCLAAALRSDVKRVNYHARGRYSKVLYKSEIDEAAFLMNPVWLSIHRLSASFLSSHAAVNMAVMSIHTVKHELAGTLTAPIRQLCKPSDIFLVIFFNISMFVK